MDETGLPIHFGDVLRQRRRALDLTQAELADRAGCSVFALRKFESGERRPSRQLAELLARALELGPEDAQRFVRVARGTLSPVRLAAPAAPTAPAAPAMPAAPPRRGRLPAAPTPLVGRGEELDALGHMLGDPLCRLLTLIGPGGIGKTRVAVEAAARAQPRFADGACFVALAQVEAGARLPQAVADALGVPLQGRSEPQAQLLAHLRGQELLLVLDNAEHLADAVAQLAAGVLEQAARVKLLVTSRTRLNLHTEWVFVIPGLPTPPAHHAGFDAARLGDYASLRLFVQSARRLRAGFTLQGEELDAAVRICRLVEGMPLGIELAAAWVAVLNCREIAAEIERSLDFLAASLRDLPDRQRSLRAVFDHSWRLLAPEEQAVLGRLAIFQGGFSRAAAQEVAGAPLPLLAALVAKSLLHYDEHGRYSLHEVVRQYAGERFARDPAWAATRARHGRYYLGLLAAREADLKGAAQRAAIHELKSEGGNLGAAWQWALGAGEFALLGAALRAYGWLCNVGVLYREGGERLAALAATLRALPAGPERARVLGVALAQLGLVTFRQGDFTHALAHLEESLALLRPLGDPALLPDSLVISGIILHLDGDYAQAQARVAEGLAAAEAAGDAPFAAYALYNLGYLASLRGDYAAGYAQMQAGLARWRALGDPSAIALGLNYLSPTAIALGRLDEAQRALEESLALLTQVGDRWGMGTANRLLGVTALARGCPAEARCFLQRSLDLFAGFITGWDVARSLTYLGDALLALGDADGAEHAFRDALALSAEVGALPLALDALAGLAALRLRAGDAAAALGLALAVLEHPACAHETAAQARRLRGAAAAGLAGDAQRAAAAWAAARPLAVLVQELCPAP